MPQWLVLDIGNTHTVAGIYEVQPVRGQPLGERPLSRVRFRTDAQATSDEYRSHLSQLFLPQARLDKIDRAIVSTVVPALEDVVRKACEPAACLLIDHETRRDFELDLPYPAQLGADRLANVAGALTLVPPPFLIVDAGTATTFCLVDQKRVYVGGSIVPGLEISWKALQSRAAKLFSVELHRPETSIGKTTETQLQSGVLLGYESLVEGMVDRHLADASLLDPSFKRATLIATGGCIQLLKLSPRFRVEPDLTLQGLLRYGQLSL